MPTGYTAGIMDGTTKDFKTFAKQCMRAFGATIHMRDDPMNIEYEPRKPSGYHEDEIAKAKATLLQYQELSDEGIVKLEEERRTASKKYHYQCIERKATEYERLTAMLKDVEAWTPPTDEHKGIKEFMINQINETINFDLSGFYHEDALLEMDKPIIASEIRQKGIEEANKSLAYSEKELAAELKRCEDSNKWVELFFSSLN